MPQQRQLEWHHVQLIRDTKHSIKPGFWAEHFNLTRATISLIRSGRIYKTEKASQAWGLHAKTSRATVEYLKLMLVNGYSLNQAARRAGVSRDHAKHIRQGKRHADVPWPNGRHGSLLQAYGQDYYDQVMQRVFANCSPAFRNAALENIANAHRK